MLQINTQKYEASGKQLIIDLNDCSKALLNDVELVKQYMLEASHIARATVIGQSFHCYAPVGVSGVVIVQESHLAIHTWPEEGYAAIDIFTCGQKVDPWLAYRYLVRVFRSQSPSVRALNRGSNRMLRADNS